MPSIFSYSQSNDASPKLARLARAQKRSKNNNASRKAQRVDYGVFESADVLDGTFTVGDTSNVDCNADTVEVNARNSDNDNYAVSTVTDMDECIIPNVSSVTSNVANVPTGAISNVSTVTAMGECNIPDVSTVTGVDEDTVPNMSTVSGFDEGTIPDVPTVTDSETVRDNSFREGQQLQAVMEHIMTLTNQNNALQMECYQLMAANTELLQKSVILQRECCKLNAQNKELRTSVCQALKDVRKEAFGYANIEENDEKTCHYTGLPTYSVFTTLFDLLKPFVIGHTLQTVAAATAQDNTAKNQFYATLVKLRHNVPMNDLAYRLHVTEATVSKFFHKWLDVMYNNLKQLIIWPDSETLRQNLPSVFHTNFARVKCIIGCFEIFIERPVAFTARAATYSSYKKHNTVKVFIGIAPTGAITFISSAWGGRVSNKLITQQCGFLNLIDPGDVILADRGFNVYDDIAIKGGRLEIPAFTKGKKQLSREEVEKSRQISRVRIHVERVIGQLRKKYTILAGPLPISLIKKPTDINVTTIDKILVVTAALTNLCKSVVQ